MSIGDGGMKRFRVLQDSVVVACFAVGLLAAVASGAMAASPIYLCINEKAGGAVKSGGAEGKCPLPTANVKYTKVALPREETEQQKLLAILPYVKFELHGVAGKPTIQVEGANLQVLSRAIPQRSGVDGTGNLVIGGNEEYDSRSEEWDSLEVDPAKQTGSNNLVIGNENVFSSYGALVAGYSSTDSGPYSDVFGKSNTAAAEASSASGGEHNRASKAGAAVSGGASNTASGLDASVSGGDENTASGPLGAVSGGFRNSASVEGSTVGGGYENLASGNYASVSGGYANAAKGLVSWVGGGHLNEALGEFDAILGGYGNKTTGIDTHFP
jgi:hypothetical protein